MLTSITGGLGINATLQLAGVCAFTIQFIATVVHKLRLQKIVNKFQLQVLN